MVLKHVNFEDHIAHTTRNSTSTVDEGGTNANSGMQFREAVGSVLVFRELCIGGAHTQLGASMLPSPTR